jgi:uroporphyrin-3 C-methyltransferase
MGDPQCKPGSHSGYLGRNKESMMTDQTETSEKPSPTQGSAWASVGMFFSVMAIIILVAGFVYGYYELMRVNTELKQMALVLQKNETNGQDATGLQKTVNELQEAMQKNAAQQEQLTSEIKTVQSSDLSKWHAMQAKNLIKMANDQLQFSHNIKMAIELLQQADKELQATTDPALLELRKSLAADLANLQAAPEIDVTSIFLRLHALHELVDKLPLPIEPLKPEPQVNTNSGSGFKASMDALWQGLNKIVIVRKNDASALPLVLPDEKIFLYQNLHAQLDNASWGLLHENAQIYTASLKRAFDWVQQYFVQDAEQTKTFLQQLTELQKVNVQPATITLTSISG